MSARSGRVTLTRKERLRSSAAGGDGAYRSRQGFFADGRYPDVHGLTGFHRLEVGLRQKEVDPVVAGPLQGDQRRSRSGQIANLDPLGRHDAVVRGVNRRVFLARAGAGQGRFGLLDAEAGGAQGGLGLGKGGFGLAEARLDFVELLSADRVVPLQAEVALVGGPCEPGRSPGGGPRRHGRRLGLPGFGQAGLGLAQLRVYLARIDHHQQVVGLHPVPFAHPDGADRPHELARKGADGLGRHGADGLVQEGAPGDPRGGHLGLDGVAGGRRRVARLYFFAASGRQKQEGQNENTNHPVGFHDCLRWDQAPGAQPPSHAPASSRWRPAGRLPTFMTTTTKGSRQNNFTF